MKRWPLIFSLIFAFSILTNPVYAYNVTYKGIDSGGTTLKTSIPSIYWGEYCSSYLTLRTTAGSSGSYTLANLWLSPDDQIVATSNPQFNNNVSCYLLNSAPITGGSSLNDFYESSSNTTHSAQTINTWLETTYDCDFDSDELFLYSNTADVDSFGNHPFSYIIRTATQCDSVGVCALNPLPDDVNVVIGHLETGYYSNCGTALTVDRSSFNGFVCGAAGNPQSWGRNDWSMTPFNSMASGQVNVSITTREYSTSAQCIGTNQTYQLYLWDTVTNSTTDLGRSVPYTGILTLQPEREYWLLLGSNRCGQKVGIETCTVDYVNTTFNISVWAYEPVWDCTDWSECVGTVQSRVCIDPAGRVAAKIEYRTCALGVLENATLGFESYEGVPATICKGEWNVFAQNYGVFSGYACSHTPINITVSRPVNWTVTGDSLYFNRYFMDFTSEWATEGSRSLKMWTIPPKEAEVDWDGSAVWCTNITRTNFPIIENLFSNDTMRANFNVTFPATNMRLTFDALKCDNVVQQHGALKLINITWGPVPLIDVTACPELCYASSCSNIPTGQFYYDLVDVNSNSLLGTTQFIDMDVIQPTGRKATIELDLTNAGIEVGTNYTLSFAVFTQQQLDTNGNCIMLDNVRYDVLEESFLSILNGVCESRCVGDDYYQATSTSTGLCIVKKLKYSDVCQPSEFEDDILNNSDYCKDSTTLRHYNRLIRDYEELDCETVCEDAHCLSAEEYAISQEAEALLQSLYDPPLFLQSIITEFTGWADHEDWEEAGYGIAWGLMSVFALYLIALIIIATGICIAIASAGTGNVTLHPIFLVIIAGGLLAGVPLQTVPWEIGLTIATMIGLLLAYEFRKGTTG